jgi:hypothetical protein
MLWTLGTALILACYRAFDDSPPRNAQALAVSFYVLIYALVHGSAIAGVLLFIQRKIAKVGGFPIQPGHWLLLIRGFSTLVWLAGWITRVAIERLCGRNILDSPLYLAIQFLPAAAVSLAGYAIALRRNPELGRIWRITLRLMQSNATLGCVGAVAVLFVDPFVGQMLPVAFTACLAPVILVSLLVALATDPDWKSRDFFHWAGVVSALASTMLPYIYQLLAAMFVVRQ